MPVEQHSPPAWRIASAPRPIWLIRCQPGEEVRVAEQIESAGLGRGAAVLSSLGDYDLLILFEDDEHRDRLLRSGPLRGVTSVREVRSFQVASGPGEAPDVLQAVKGGTVVGVTFIRLPGFFTRRDLRAMTAETEFLAAFAHRGDGDPESSEEFLLGTVGGPEFVVVRIADRWEQLGSWLERSRCNGHSESTYTLIATSLDMFHLDRPLEVGRCSKPLEVVLHLTCHPSDRRRILDRALQFVFGAEAWDGSLPRRSRDGLVENRMNSLVPGTEDLQMSFMLHSGADLGSFLRSILRFRAGEQGAIYNTRTRIQFPYESLASEPASAPHRPERTPRGHLVVEGDQARAILSIPEIGGQVIRALYAYGDMFQDRVLGNELADMLSYFFSFQREAIELGTAFAEAAVLGAPIDADLQEAARDLGERLSAVHLGVDQRTLGVQAGINPVEADVRHMLGGCQRTLQAAEALGLHVFRSHDGSPWPGFVVVGSAWDHLTHHYQVVQIPTSRMFEPHRWTTLLHEAGHCLIEAKSALTGSLRMAVERLEATARKLDRDFHGSQLAPGQFAELVADVWQEVLVDQVALRFSPIWAPALVRNAFWEDVARSSRGHSLREDLLATQCALRSIFLTLGATALEGRHFIGSERGPEVEDLDGAVDELRLWAASSQPDAIVREALEHVLETDQRELFLEAAKLLFPLFAASVALPVVPSGKEWWRDRRAWWEGPREDLLARIEDGVVCDLEGLVHPDLFVWALRAAPRVQTPVAATAAILSLLSSYRTRMQELRELALGRG